MTTLATAMHTIQHWQRRLGSARESTHRTPGRLLHQAYRDLRTQFEMLAEVSPANAQAFLEESGAVIRSLHDLGARHRARQLAILATCLLQSHSFFATQAIGVFGGAFGERRASLFDDDLDLETAWVRNRPEHSPRLSATFARITTSAADQQPPLLPLLEFDFPDSVWVDKTVEYSGVYFDLDYEIECDWRVSATGTVNGYIFELRVGSDEFALRISLDTDFSDPANDDRDRVFPEEPRKVVEIEGSYAKFTETLQAQGFREHLFVSMAQNDTLRGIGLFTDPKHVEELVDACMAFWAGLPEGTNKVQLLD